MFRRPRVTPPAPQARAQARRWSDWLLEVMLEQFRYCCILP